MRRTTIDFSEEEDRKIACIKEYLDASFDKEAIRRIINITYEIISDLRRGDKIYMKSAAGEMREIKFF